MKKILKVVPVFLLCFLLAACYGSSGEVDNGTGTQGSTMTDEEFKKLNLDDAAIGNVTQENEDKETIVYNYVGSANEENWQAIAELKVKNDKVIESKFDYLNQDGKKLSEVGSQEEKDALNYFANYLKQYQDLDHFDEKILGKAQDIAEEYKVVAKKLLIASGFLDL